jgi:hypothetical protein
MNSEELEVLTKPELIDLVLGMQRPDKTSRTSSKPPPARLRLAGGSLSSQKDRILHKTSPIQRLVASG